MITSISFRNIQNDAGCRSAYLVCKIVLFFDRQKGGCLIAFIEDLQRKLIAFQIFKPAHLSISHALLLSKPIYQPTNPPFLHIST